MDKKATIKSNSLKTGAKASLLVLQISTVLQLMAFFQTKYTLDSPIIPQHITMEVATPFILNALIAGLFSIAALIFYFYSKFTFVIILCILPLVWQQVYHYF
jgi:hypothetical protein